MGGRRHGRIGGCMRRAAAVAAGQCRGLDGAVRGQSAFPKKTYPSLTERKDIIHIYSYVDKARIQII